MYSVIVTSTMIDTDVPVVFMPLYKSIKQQPVSNKKNTSSSSGGVQTVAKSDESVKEAGIRHEKKGTTIGVVPPKKTKKNAKAKKEQKVKKAATSSTKKQSAVKQKPEPVKQQPKIIEPTVKEDPIKPNPSPSQQSEPVVPPVAQNALDAAGQEVVYVGREEMEALQLQEYIQQEMAQHWSPPPGMPKESACTIKISIGFDGSITDLDVEQSSGVLVFDSAARKAASHLTPPQWAYGKTLRITFKP